MNKCLYFIAGTLLGSAISFFFTKRHYDKEMEAQQTEHVAEMNQMIAKNQEILMSRKPESKVTVITNEPKEEEEKPIDTTATVHKEPEQKTNYSNFADSKPVMTPIEDDICFIDPSEFGEDDLYGVCEWMVYSDGIVTDENDEIVHGYQEYIGDAINHIGQFEPEQIHIKNNKLKIYYEITQAHYEYAEGMEDLPPNKYGR